MELLKQRLIDKFANEQSGHDFDHLQRVVNNARFINDNQDAFLVELTAWLHDYFDDKFYQGNISKDLKQLLQETSITLSENDYLQLESDLSNFGFKGGFNKEELSEVAKVVQDADYLDAIGAIGIARACIYGGFKGSKLYGEDGDSETIDSLQQYRKKRSILQHFDDKLLKLKDLMNTPKGKELAQERHQFMEAFLSQINKEINLK